jgi:glycosyltransferase involved in cell wall biosynthesis
MTDHLSSRPTPAGGGVLAPTVRQQVALVEWSGSVGGAETFTNALAVSLRGAGVDARVVFVGEPFPGCRELEAQDVPFVSFGAERGRQILRSPRSFAAVVHETGPDAAILPSGGFLAAAIRLGGYKGRLVAIEHGALPTTRRVLRRADQRSGIWALDAQVAVSDYIRQLVLARTHAPQVERIYSGIDLKRFSPGQTGRGRRPFTVGFVGRLLPGKGVDHLLVALASMRNSSTHLVIAGEGSERKRLERLSSYHGLSRRVRFLGLHDDIPAVWQTSDVCAVPSVAPEGAGMVALEAASCAKPVVASAAGGLPELVFDGRTGVIVPPGDVEALARALDRYAEDPGLRALHGTAGRRSCETNFDIRRCAEDYVNLLSSLKNSSNHSLRPRRSSAVRASTLKSEG